MGPGVASVNSSDRRPGSTRYPDATQKTNTHIVEKIPKHRGSLRVLHGESSSLSALRSKAQMLTVFRGYCKSAVAATRQLTRGPVPVSDIWTKRCASLFAAFGLTGALVPAYIRLPSSIAY